MFKRKLLLLSAISDTARRALYRGMVGVEFSNYTFCCVHIARPFLFIYLFIYLWRVKSSHYLQLFQENWPWSFGVFSFKLISNMLVQFVMQYEVMNLGLRAALLIDTNTCHFISCSCSGEPPIQWVPGALSLGIKR